MRALVINKVTRISELTRSEVIYGYVLRLENGKEGLFTRGEIAQVLPKLDVINAKFIETREGGYFKAIEGAVRFGELTLKEYNSGLKRLPPLVSVEQSPTKVAHSISSVPSMKLFQEPAVKEAVTLTLWHGSPCTFREFGVSPRLDKCNAENDLGLAFYLSDKRDEGESWALVHGRGLKDGYLYGYTSKLSELRGFDFDYSNATGWLAWIATIIKYREKKYSVVNDNILKTFVGAYALDVESYDVIKSYRCDDRFYSYIEGFANGDDSFGFVCKAAVEGSLGWQYAFKTEKALNALSVAKGSPFVVDKAKYAVFLYRLRTAMDNVERLRVEMRGQERRTGVYIDDIVRELGAKI